MLNIVYEDAQLLVCYKPAGVAVQNASIGKLDMESMVRNYLAEKNGRPVPYLGVIHRLDQPVQGLVVFAKDGRSAASLSAQVQDGRMKKYYLAVADAIPKASSAELVHYLKKDARTNTSCVVGKNVPGAKKAQLRYQMVQSEVNSGKVLMEIELFTGRHHQIRVQMAAAGIPLTGDRKYNPAADTQTGIGLCAYKLEFDHPKNGKKMKFSCNPTGGPFEMFDELN